jgi:hypothetical protein
MTRQNGAIPSPSDTAFTSNPSSQSFLCRLQTSEVFIHSYRRERAMPTRENTLKSTIIIGYYFSISETCPYMVRQVRGFLLPSFFSFREKKRNFERTTKARAASQSHFILSSGRRNLVHSNKMYN